MDPSHLLRAQRVLEVGQLLALEGEAVVDHVLAARGRHEEVPQTGAARLRLELLDDRQRLPALAGSDLGGVLVVPRSDEHVDEPAYSISEKGLPLAEGKIQRFRSLAISVLFYATLLTILDPRIQG